MILGADPLTLSRMGIRFAEIQDLPLVFSSWLKSYRKHAATQGLSNDVYFSGQRELIARLLQRATVRLLVSVEDPSHIYGWACTELSGGLPVLHYVYVKQTYRRLGFARLLLGDLLTTPVAYSHLGEFTGKLASGSHFNPYKAIV